MLPTPYVSADAFTAHPTYLDLDDLRSGSSSTSDQTAALVNILLMASQWADGYADQTLGAHTAVYNTRARCDRSGYLHVHLPDRPYLGIAQVGYGYTPTALTTLTNPQVWEENNNLTIPMTSGGAWSGSLQFGSPASGADLYVQVIYRAGWVASQLAAASDEGDTTLTVADPTGIQPGGQYRIWDPGSEETVTVAANWVPISTGTPSSPVDIPLAGPTTFAHGTGQDFSRMPADMRLAIINYGVSQLMRPDTSREDEYPDTTLSSGTRQNDPRQDGSGLVAEARRILDRYARIR